MAKEAGFNVSADLITKAQSEISNEELENVAGGRGRHGDPTWVPGDVGCGLLQVIGF
ncbi:MAG: hypothetical protein CBC48_22215 [bacterium TMED88]|nr:hypothetical protein [Deltaproteobacteria bacterium]OUV18882.1 MAG: hypothetical protein CBC48_22215 [bacterium TMED88]